MKSLNPAVAQERHHVVHILLCHSKRDMVPVRVLVPDRSIDLEEPKHPPCASIGVQQKGTQVAPAEAQLKSKLPHVEIDGTTQPASKRKSLMSHTGRYPTVW